MSPDEKIDMVTASEVYQAASPSQAQRLRDYWRDPGMLDRRLTALSTAHPDLSPPAALERLLENIEHYNYYQESFVAALQTEPAIRGRVLDIGCGGDLPGCLIDMPRLCGQLDGVDPAEEVQQHPHLAQRWHGTFEDAPVPCGAYDLAYAYNVVEHIPTARPFFEKLKSALKPGGVFWALTPNSRHAFAKLSRLGEVIGLKGAIARRHKNVNPYSSYYRLNSPKQVLRGIEGLGFAQAEFFFDGAWGCNWQNAYMPRGVRWIGSVYDRLIARPFESRRLIVSYRLVA